MSDLVISLTAQEEIYTYDFKIWNWEASPKTVIDFLLSFNDEELEKMYSVLCHRSEDEPRIYCMEYATSFFYDEMKQALKDKDLWILARWAIVLDYIRLIVRDFLLDWDLRKSFKQEYLEKAIILGEYEDFEDRLMDLYDQHLYKINCP